jgi:hypothetical protein
MGNSVTEALGEGLTLKIKNSMPWYTLENWKTEEQTEGGGCRGNCDQAGKS